MFYFVYSTLLHQLTVNCFIWKFCIKLIWRGIWHDWSKYSGAERTGFIKYTPLLKQVNVDDPKYQEYRTALAECLKHHYSKNSHHPEHYINGVDGMNLADLVEMWCDWQAAVKRHKNGNPKDSLKYCKTRFNISEQLNSIMENTL